MPDTAYILTRAGLCTSSPTSPSQKHPLSNNAIGMPSLIGILILLSELSAVSAGPLRRYNNSTSQSSGSVSAQHDDHSKETSSQTLVNGITVLPSSLLAGVSEEKPTALSATTIAGSEPSSSAADFAWATGDGVPTSSQTSGDENVVTTLTVWSTQWTTVPPSASTQASTKSSSPQDTRSAQLSQSTTSSEEPESSTLLFSYDPILSYSPSTTKPGSPSKSCSESSVSSSQKSSSVQLPVTVSSDNVSSLEHPASTFTFSSPKVPAPVNITSVSSNREAPTSLPMFGSGRLPEIVFESTSATQPVHDVTTSDQSSLPGITIVPQNPSVVYITTTVIDAGATTTVTA